jgi:hypothetical protein
MTKRIIISITAIVVLAGVSLLAAEKAKEKKAAEKPQQEAKQPVLSEPVVSTVEPVEGPKRPEALLDQLVAAYKANDREKMGELINKMQQRREKMREFARFNKWHRWAHRRWERPFDNAPPTKAFEGRQGRGWGMGGCGFAPPCPHCGCQRGMPGWNRPGCFDRPMCGGYGFGPGQGCMRGPGWKPEGPAPKDKAPAGPPADVASPEQESSDEADW